MPKNPNQPVGDAQTPGVIAAVYLRRADYDRFQQEAQARGLALSAYLRERLTRDERSESPPGSERHRMTATPRTD